MDKAKIRLSQVEKDLVNNAGWILTKNEILEKVKLLLGGMHPVYEQRLHAFTGLPPEVYLTTPKISRGENYRGLPYLVLDYPRLFDRDDIFAIRTLFWWGHFFSITLQLSGRYKKIAEEKIIRSISGLAESGYFICTAEDPWQHHFEKENYLPVSGLNAAAIAKRLSECSFIKLAVKTDLQHWDDCEEILPVYFTQMLELAVP